MVLFDVVPVLNAHFATQSQSIGFAYNRTSIDFQVYQAA